MLTQISRRALLAQTVKRLARPNLLFIVADGWRGQALPSAGDPNLIAPNLARLAKDGLDCRRTYTSYAVCCPSRASMLTGKMPHAAGVTRNHSLLPLDQPTMSVAMRAAGYRTGYIGKWHLDGRASPGFVPAERRRGFDYWAAYNLQHQHFDSFYYRDNPEPIQVRGFEADTQTGLAIDFLSQPSTQPFYLYLSWVPPHAPFTPPPGVTAYSPAALRLRPNVPAGSEAKARKDQAGYYGLCSALDANLGRVLKTLDERRLTDNTIVVFTADHGQMLGEHGMESIDMPYEEASRIPFLLRYPKRIRAATTSDALLSNIDFAPLLLDLCGLPAMPGVQGQRGQRRSVYTEGSMGDREEWRMLVEQHHKLVVDGKLNPTHLFDLRADPYEMDNRASASASRSRLAALLRLLRQTARRTGDPLVV